jgi:hypothetical protein
MSSQSVPPHVAAANAVVRASSLLATIGRVARLVWRSSERHSLYPVMLAGAHDEGLQDIRVRDPR